LAEKQNHQKQNRLHARMGNKIALFKMFTLCQDQIKKEIKTSFSLIEKDNNKPLYNTIHYNYPV